MNEKENLFIKLRKTMLNDANYSSNDMEIIIECAVKGGLDKEVEE